ncbi:hypothetical protein [Marinimicrobium sp. C2-29]|uniref:hypothetical protein n=1 Tax=Marinimicrobium sp. C2-29 TaxID=3139825 RepID=UPI003139A431
MKLSTVKEKLLADEVIIFDVMPNPSDFSEWIVWAREPSGGSYLLINDDESIVGSKDANRILLVLKDLGVRNVHFSL